jgi:hypothetical protein
VILVFFVAIVFQTSETHLRSSAPSAVKTLQCSKAAASEAPLPEYPVDPVHPVKKTCHKYIQKYPYFD